MTPHNFLEKGKKIGILFLLAVFTIVVIGTVAYAVDTTLCHGSNPTVNGNLKDCYKAPGTNNGSTQIEVKEYGDDICFSNFNALDLLVPTNTGPTGPSSSVNEWGRFKLAIPNIHVNVTTCPGGVATSTCSSGAAGFGISRGRSPAVPGNKADATGAAQQDLRNHISASSLSSSTKTEFLSKTASIIWPTYSGFLTNTISTTYGPITSSTYLEGPQDGAGGASTPGYDAEVDWDYPASVCQ